MALHPIHHPNFGLQLAGSLTVVHSPHNVGAVTLRFIDQRTGQQNTIKMRATAQRKKAVAEKLSQVV